MALVVGLLWLRVAFAFGLAWRSMWKGGDRRRVALRRVGKERVGKEGIGRQ